jgi:hypothetical protein
MKGSDVAPQESELVEGHCMVPTPKTDALVRANESL